MPDALTPRPDEELLAHPPASLQVHADLDGVRASLLTLGVCGLRLLWVDQLPWVLPLAGTPLVVGLLMALALPAALAPIAYGLATLYMVLFIAAAWLVRSQRVPVVLDHRSLRMGSWSRPLRDIRHVLVAHGFFGQPFLYVVSEGQVWMWCAYKGTVSGQDLQWLVALIRVQAERAGTPLEPVPEPLRALLEKRGRK